MSVIMKAAAVVAQYVLSNVAKELLENIDVKVLEKKIAEIIQEVLKDCTASPAEMLIRCRRPGKRELVQLKLATRRVFAEHPNEPKELSLLRSHLDLIQAAIVKGATEVDVETTLAALKELFGKK